MYQRGPDLLEFCSINNLAEQTHFSTITPDRQSTKCENQAWADCKSNHKLLVIDMRFRLKKLTKPIAVMRIDYTARKDEYR